jgi:DNA-binding transcriptional MerR regulator
MRIGEVAERTGLSASRIRFYETSGVIPAARRTANGYRDYDPAVVDDLRQIDTGQKLGFSLEEIRDIAAIVRHCEKGGRVASRARVLKVLAAKLVELEAMQRRLKESRRRLLALMDALQNTPADRAYKP